MSYPIVVGTDLTEASDAALIAAEARARRDGSSLTVVHVISPSLWVNSDVARDNEQARRSIQQRVRALTGRSEGDYRVAVEHGFAHVVLARWALSQQALLVVGTHMHHGFAHALLRDVTERVVARARQPVLVVHPVHPVHPVGPVLVAVDFPLEPFALLDVAAEEAEHAGSKLAVVHCIDSGLIQTLAADLIRGGAYGQQPLSSRTNEVRVALASALEHRRANADVRIIDGDPQPSISGLARELKASLLVLGASHRSGRPSRVTTATLRHAPCSVLVVDEHLTLAADPPVRGRLEPVTDAAK